MRKTAEQWREELRRRLSSINRTNRSVTAAVIRQFIVDIMSEDEKNKAIVVRGVAVYPEFESVDAKNNYIQKMGTNHVWLEHSCLRAFAAALDITLMIHAPGSKHSDAYNYRSTQSNASTFHIANFSENHWSAALKDDTSGLLEVIPTPGDGNCGAHALYSVWQLHENNHMLQKEAVIDSQAKEVKEDFDLIEARKKALNAVFNKENTKTNSVIASFESLKKIAEALSQQPDDLGVFVKEHLARIMTLEHSGTDKASLLVDLFERIAARVSVEQESMNLLSAILVAQDQLHISQALTQELAKLASVKPSTTGMFSRSCSKNILVNETTHQTAAVF